MSAYEPRTTARGVLLFAVLSFAGLALIVLGLQYRQAVLAAFGAVFLLITVFVFRSSLTLPMLLGALVGMAVGSGAGILLGLLLGGAAEWLVGVIGGAVLGAATGAILAGCVAGAVGIPILPGIGINLLPRVVINVLLAAGAIVGAVIGAIGLKEHVTRVFGPVGGGAVAVGTLGLVAGLLVVGQLEHGEIE